MIRDLLREDLAELALLYECFWDEKSDPGKMNDMFSRLDADPAYIHLCYIGENGRMVGTVMGIVCHELYGECRPFMVLENMVVKPDMRKKGIGRELFLELEKRAGLARCSQIILVTEKSRRDACSFYESLGFMKQNTGYKKKLNF